MNIIDSFTDLAGKYRVTVLMDDNTAITLKFQSVISDAEVLTEATRVKADMDARNAIESLPSISFDL